MSYLGQVELKSSEIRRIDVTGSTSATHTLTWTPASEQSLIITINGIKQQNNYSISGVTLTLDDALLSADAMEVVGILDIGEAVVPPDDSISTAKIQDDAVTAAKLANSINTEIAANTAKVTNATHTGDVTGATGLTIAANAVNLAKLEDGTQGDILYYGASGAPARLGFGTTGDFLKTQGTGANPVWATISGGLANASTWRMTTDFTGDADPILNWEEADTDGAARVGDAMTESSGVFTFPNTGKWEIIFVFQSYGATDLGTSFNNARIKTTIDNSSYLIATRTSNGNFGLSREATSTSHFIFDVTDTAQCKVRFGIDTQQAANTCQGDTDHNETHAVFKQLGTT